MTIRTFLLAGAALMAATAANAAQVAALVGNDTIAIVDTDQKKAIKSMKVTGISGGLVGIDVRPADGLLYGLVDDGTVVTIAADGKATQKSKLDTMLAKGVMATVDFNPAADRLRVMGADGMNLRVNVDDGTVTKDGDHKFADGDTNKSAKPNLVAGANTGLASGTVGRPASLIMRVSPIVPGAATLTAPRTGRFTAATRARSASSSWTTCMRGSNPR